MLRWSLFIAIALAVAAFIALLVSHGLGEILAAVSAIGWGLAVIVLIRLASLSLAGLAWGQLLAARVRRPGRLYIGLRIVREAINALLPAAQVGGDIIGGRLLTDWGVCAGLAGASILVDLLMQTATQGVFAVSGLLALWLLHGDGPMVQQLGDGLLLAIPALGGFFLAQRFGLFTLVDRGLGTIRRWCPSLAPDRPIDLQSSLSAIYHDYSALAAACLLHGLGWSLGVAEIWVALDRMGAAPSLSEALVLESLGQAVRSAAFAVPGALGIQEGGFVLLGALFGLSPAMSLGLSLAKRVPDLVIGIPGLIAWQGLEAVRLRGTRSAGVT